MIFYTSLEQIDEPVTSVKRSGAHRTGYSC